MSSNPIPEAPAIDPRGILTFDPMPAPVFQPAPVDATVMEQGMKVLAEKRETREAACRPSWVRKNPMLFTGIMLAALTALGIGLYFGKVDMVKEFIDSHRNAFLIAGGAVWGGYGLVLAIVKGSPKIKRMWHEHREKQREEQEQVRGEQRRNASYSEKLEEDGPDSLQNERRSPTGDEE